MSQDQSNANPDDAVEEQLTVLKVFLKDLNSALEKNDMDVLQHTFALVRSKLESVEALPTENVNLTLVSRLEKEIAEAKKIRDSTEKVIDLAVKFGASKKLAPSTSATSHIKWTWTATPFHGKAAEWSTWWDVFRTTIHENSELIPEFKMKCLTESLKGEANDVLGKMDRVGSNYEAAVDLLVSRFGDPKVLSQSYYEQLNALNAATDLRSQRKVLDKLNAIVRNLNSIRDKISLDEQSILKKIMKKFPDEVLRWAVTRVESSKPDLRLTPSDLLESLESVLHVDDFICTFKYEEESTPSTSSAGPKPVGVLAAGGAGGKKRPNSNASGASKEKRLCIFCGLSHPSSLCRRFATIAARRSQLTIQKRCFNCLMQYHEAKLCKNPASICENCGKSHHTAMCIVNMQKRVKSGKLVTFDGSFLQTFICYLHSNDESFEIRGLLDPGSSFSFIDFQVVQKLKIHSRETYSFECSRFADPNVTCVTGKLVIVGLVNNKNESKFFRFHTTPCVAGAMATSPHPKIIEKILPSNLEYADYDIFGNNPRPIKLLIGADIYNEVVSAKNVQILPCGVNLLDTFFGWCPSGGIRNSTIEGYSPAKKSCSVFSLACNLNRIESATKKLSQNEIINLDKKLETLWTLETIGIENPESLIMHDTVVEYYNRTTYVDELMRKNVRLPWKDNSNIPTNFRVALARLKQLVGSSSKELLQQGDNHFRQQLEMGIIEDAPPLKQLANANASKNDEPIRVHYLPHQWLIQKNKIRAVCDASSHTKNGPSLNECLHPGFNLTQDIIKLLISFRLYSIGLVADIEKAYLMISLNEVDRDATRFLWLKDITKPITYDNLWYLRFARLPFGLNISPFLLNIVLQDIFSTPPVNKFLLQGQEKFYVDNLVTSVNTPVEAIGLFEAMSERLKSIQMNLRDWASNDATIISALPKEKLDPTIGDISVLGLMWNREVDYLTIKLNLDLPFLGTKRNILQFYASIYDPLGLLAPCLLDLKCLIQKCWKLKYQWDEVLPPQLNAEWLKLRHDATQIPTVKIPRKLWNYSEPGTYELHIFCDASHKAYACCAYLLYTSVDKNFTASQLIFAKARLAPMNPLSTPRLELMGLLIAARNAVFLRKILPIELTKTLIWTDSTTNLQWLHSTEVLPPFVKNRIVEIKNVPNLSIKYVPSDDNSADLASRGKSVAIIKNSLLWHHGPEWLCSECLWPRSPVNVENFNTSTSNRTCASFVLARAQDALLNTELEKNISTWYKHVRVFYTVIKYCFLRAKPNHFISDVKAMKLAERLLIIELQRKYFLKEYTLLKKGENPQNNLDLFLDEHGIIRCKGRLLYARFPWETTHPILLPRDSLATHNYIRDLHVNNHHIGVSHTLAKFRERFWIIKGRAKVRSVLYKCTTCRYWEGGHYPMPPIPPLPESRLCDVTPFLQVGIDYFGPLHIKDHDGEIIDVQVLIFTCLVTRAVHLELTPDNSGEQFILAFDRFCSLRRVPKLIISDNGKTFKFIQPMVGIQVEIRDHKVNKLINANRIEWYFIPEYAPWFGGVYERLIGIIKRCLKKSYGKVLLTYIELYTVLYKIADIINSRPLSYVSSEEIVEPLTPNHFLKLGPTNINLSMEPTPKPPLSITGDKLMKNWELISRILDAYWDAFRHLYVLALRERHTTHHKRQKGTVPFTPKVGDVVLMQENSMPRAYWKIGKIEKLDRRQAIAYVRCQRTTYIRSIRHLYPLEVPKETPLTSESLEPLP